MVGHSCLGTPPLHSLGLFILGLKHVPFFIFKLNIPVRFVLYEHSVDLASIRQNNARSANASSVCPFAFVVVLIVVVVISGTIPKIIFKCAFIILAVGEQNLNLAVNH